MKEFRLPDPGEGLVEAEIVTWLVAEGDLVKVNDILLEIETSKSLVELPSPFAGTVAKLLVPVGTTVEVGTPIILIDDGSPAEVAPDPVDVAPLEADEEQEAMLVGYGAKSSAVARRPRKGVATRGGPVAEQVHESYGVENPVSRPTDATTSLPPLTAEPAGEPLPDPGVLPPPAPGSKRALAKPPVRRLARDLGLDLDALEGTGPAGTITAEDVVAAASAAQGGTSAGQAAQGGTSAGQAAAAPSVAAATATASATGDRRVPLKGVRREMARSMTASLKVPQATAMVQAEVTASMELVEELRNRKEFNGLRVSPLLIFAKAACLAISNNPDINSSLDMESEEIILRDQVNLGIAAATPRGLMVPNIKGANRMNLVQLAQALSEMVQVAKLGKVQPADMAQGTFTITNVGVFGVDGGTPILNVGESAIMCLGTISRRPWVVGKGADERIEPRWVCTISLTFDHRLVDGEIASKFLNDVATMLRNPGLALMY